MPVLAAVWLMALVPGVRYLMAYEKTAGAQGAVPAGWPAGVPAEGKSDIPTLVVALHPKCSYSEATLTELEGAAENAERPFNTVLYVYEPEGLDPGAQDLWEDRANYREAAAKLGATVVPDVAGRYAAKFGALTSGAVLYYSARRVETGQRELLFSGGVTAGRGLTGENAGVESLKAALYSDRPAGLGMSPVFGCGLFGNKFEGLEAAR